MIILCLPVQEDDEESEPDDEKTQSYRRVPPTGWTEGDSSSEHACAKQRKDSSEPVKSPYKFVQPFLYGLPRAEGFNTGYCPKCMQEEDSPEHRDKVESSPPLYLSDGQHVDG